ncbi:MAG TPA: TIGR03032 family protein [Patescibacteria group bacterium]|nr:TIGR03032 family protein [Patescibacteria group bacterium]
MSDATPAPVAENKAPPVTFAMSDGFIACLARLNISLALTSYQSGKFYLLGRNPQGALMVHARIFEKAMGLHVAGNTLLLATHFQMQRFENGLPKGKLIQDTYDACYVPRTTHNTGVLDAHDVGQLSDGRIIFVNTLFNCLATTSPKDSFIPVWKPAFISAIVGEDRCHLNGLAVENGAPRYVTACGVSDTDQGWRPHRGGGGVVIDVRSNEIVCEGMSMPHSPRLHNGELWVLNSGTGELGTVDTAARKFQPRAFCPGFLRGLSFHGNYAFVGLSKPRDKHFEGLALDGKLSDAGREPVCGIEVIDLATGKCVEWFHAEGAMTEVYDVAVVPGLKCPMSLGFADNDIKGFLSHPPLDQKILAGL